MHKIVSSASEVNPSQNVVKFASYSTCDYFRSLINGRLSPLLLLNVRTISNQSKFEP